MKTVLIDSSSMILLYKCGWLDATLANYRLLTGRTVSQELTVPGYPGADRFQRLAANGRIEVLPIVDALHTSKDASLNEMGPGERECISHFLAGSGQFILLDDGQGARYCRAHRIPYTNALMIPRILALADPTINEQIVADAMAEIARLGRYATWVLEYARNCEDAALSPFLP
jgi:hypothetical protein